MRVQAVVALAVLLAPLRGFASDPAREPEEVTRQAGSAFTAELHLPSCVASTAQVGDVWVVAVSGIDRAGPEELAGWGLGVYAFDRDARLLGRFEEREYERSVLGDAVSPRCAVTVDAEPASPSKAESAILVTVEVAGLRTVLLFRQGTFHPVSRLRAGDRLGVRKATTRGLYDLERATGAAPPDLLFWTGERYAAMTAERLAGDPSADPLFSPWVAMARASSTLPARGAHLYAPLRAVDGAADTAWAEGSRSDGVGELLELTFDAPLKLARLKLLPGCGATPAQWKKNERLKQVRLTFEGGRTQVADLEDSTGPDDWKTVAVEAPAPTRTLTLEVLAVYRATFKDACLSELAFELEPPVRSPCPATTAAFLGLKCGEPAEAVASRWKLGDKGRREALEKAGVSFSLARPADPVSGAGGRDCAALARLAPSLAPDDLARCLCGATPPQVGAAFDGPGRAQLLGPQDGVLDGAVYRFAGGAVRVAPAMRGHVVKTLDLSCP